MSSILFFILGLVPIAFVAKIIFQRDQVDPLRKKLFFLTIVLGMTAVPLVLLVNLLSRKFLGIDLNVFTATQSIALLEFGGNIGMMIKDFFTGGILLKLFIGVFGLACIEEAMKALLVTQVHGRSRQFNRVIDGVEFAIAAALGFSLVENIVYFRLIQDAFIDIHTVLPALIIRALISTTAHIMFSGIFGYYYGKARALSASQGLHPLSPEQAPSWRMFHMGNAVKVRFFRSWAFLSGKNLHEKFARQFKQDELIAEGILVAGVLHAIFNFTLTLGIGYLVVPLLVIEYAIISHEFHVGRNFENHGLSSEN